MTHVVIDLTRSPHLPHVYEADRYLFAVRGLVRLGAALSRAACRVTVLADPVFIRTPIAQAAMDGAPRLVVTEAADNTSVPAALDTLRPDAMAVWNGSHIPETVQACRARDVAVLFAEAGWFDRDGSIFLDTLGVMVASSLAEFAPSPGLSDRTRQARLAAFAQMEQRRRPIEQDYLLVLLDGGSGWTYFDARHADPAVLLAQLREQFPDRVLAVRGHPAARDRLPARLPDGVVLARDGALLDWAAYCTAAIGASSKAVFAPPLFDRPVILIGASVASGPRPSLAFAQRQRINRITEADLLDRSQSEAARAFVYEAVFHRHVYFDDCSAPALAQNRVLAPFVT